MRPVHSPLLLAGVAVAIIPLAWQLVARSPSSVVSGFTAVERAAGSRPGDLAQAQTQPPPPTFRTEANYVRVDVFPTEDGKPIADLTRADFEILEGGTPQTIDQFEHIVIRGGMPQETRREPSTVEESRQAAQNPRARVVVLFLDVNHVDVAGSHNIRKPLVDALDRLIGPEDLIAVMTPEMSAKDIVFARKTTTIDGFLTRYWHWGERNQLNSKDPVEDAYRLCYPGFGPNQTCADDDRGVADEMIERRREKATIDALYDLVRYLRGVREERKAVLAITDGWRIFGANQALARQLYCRVPQAGIGINPRTARPTADPVAPGQASQLMCERDRQTLAYMDDELEFRRLLDEANAANTSFYPIDPRGLVVFDEPIHKFTTGSPPPGSTTITPPTVDAARLRSRLTSLRTLAEATDGLAIVDSNNLAAGLKRVVDDLTSYYLIGYYSTGKLDGRFHPITVKVKRPGVNVRARRGYLASTPEAAARMAAAAAGAKAADPAADAEAHAIEAAIGPLAGYMRDVPMRLQVAAGWKPASATATFSVVGEIGGVAVVGDAFADGFEATVTLTSAEDARTEIASGRVTVERRARTFRLELTPPPPLEPGDYVLRVGARAGSAGIPTRDTMRIALPEPPESFGAIFLRRGQATGNRDMPTADLRFRRSEQIRVEIPAGDASAVSARLLDRTGKPLAVPVTASLRDDADGSRWLTAQLALAPLATGDYMIEMTAKAGGADAAATERRSLSAFRVVP
jgi:VWFA-related protein